MVYVDFLNALCVQFHFLDAVLNPLLYDLRSNYDDYEDVYRSFRLRTFIILLVLGSFIYPFSSKCGNYNRSNNLDSFLSAPATHICSRLNQIAIYSFAKPIAFLAFPTCKYSPGAYSIFPASAELPFAYFGSLPSPPSVVHAEQRTANIPESTFFRTPQVDYIALRLSLARVEII